MPEDTQHAPVLTEVLPLPLPAVDGLSDAQRRGAACAWCHTPLTAEAAVDAGERPADDGGQLFPRGCVACAGRAAYRMLWEHAPHCEHCQTDPACPVAMAARRLMRAARL